jgi:sec-independent protein translocase protein TatA
MFEGLFQPMHLLVILFIAVLVFGPKRLPELGKGLGDGIRSFRSAMREGDKGRRREGAEQRATGSHQAVSGAAVMPRAAQKPVFLMAVVTTRSEVVESECQSK